MVTHCCLSACFSELLASVLLIMTASAELIADDNIMLNLKTRAARLQALQNFVISLVFQLVALKISDALVKYKEARWAPCC